MGRSGKNPHFAQQSLKTQLSASRASPPSLALVLRPQGPQSAAAAAALLLLLLLLLLLPAAAAAGGTAKSR